MASSCAAVSSLAAWRPAGTAKLRVSLPSSPRASRGSSSVMVAGPWSTTSCCHAAAAAAAAGSAPALLPPPGWPDPAASHSTSATAAWLALMQQRCACSSSSSLSGIMITGSLQGKGKYARLEEGLPPERQSASRLQGCSNAIRMCLAKPSIVAPTHSSSATTCGWHRASSCAAWGGSRTDHSTPGSSSAGVAAGRWPPGTDGPPAPGVLALAHAGAAAPWPDSCMSACCRAALLASKSPLSCGFEACAPLLPPPLPASLLSGCWLLLPVAAEMEGKCRDASALTIRHRCCLPVRSDCSTQAGDTMPTPAPQGGGHRQVEEES